MLMCLLVGGASDSACAPGSQLMYGNTNMMYSQCFDHLCSHSDYEFRSSNSAVGVSALGVSAMRVSAMRVSAVGVSVWVGMSAVNMSGAVPNCFSKMCTSLFA